MKQVNDLMRSNNLVRHRRPSGANSNVGKPAMKRLLDHYKGTNYNRLFLTNTQSVIAEWREGQGIN